MTRMCLFLIGFGLMVIGCTYIITYMNLISMGYSVTQYLRFILSKVECQFAIIGFLITSIIILTKGNEKDDIHI